MKRIILLTSIMAGSLYAFAQTGTYAAGTNAGNSGSYNYNTSVGVSAGDVITSHNGSYFGFEAGGLVTTAAGSFFGYQSGKSNTGSSNSFFGYKTGTVTTGSNNMFAGYEAGVANTSGTSSVFVGYRAGYATTTGGSNTFIGYRAGQANVTGTGNVFIGKDAGYSETSSDKLYIDNSSTSTPLIFGNFSSNQVGINSLPNTTHALTVGGSIYSSGIYVNGVQFVNSQWTTSGANINFNSGIVSIGTTLTPVGAKLAVGGKVVATEVVIALTGSWPDYVFAKNYDLLPLNELQKFINLNQHLPGVPDAATIEKDGISVGEMNVILLKKIEEMSLYILDIENRLKNLESNNPNDHK